MAKPKQKYYVVWVGRETGVFTDWATCEAQVKGFENARYKSFLSRDEAEKAFANGAPSKSVAQKQSSAAKSKSSFSSSKKVVTTAVPIVPSLCVDAACSGNPGMMEYKGVYLLDIHSGNQYESTQLFLRGPFKEGTNNIGEFLALVHGLAELHKQGNSTLPVYSDSRTAIAWVRSKKAKTLLKPTKQNAILFELISRAENWLNTHTWFNPIYKWDTPRWGEIPADFGRK